MNILLLGSGGREHAFASKIKQSVHCAKLYIAKGNPGTAQLGENVTIDIADFESLGNFCIQKNITLIVVGPEVPLVQGIYDFFKNKTELKHIRVFGASKQGAQLEGSKQFSKAFMLRHAIPTAMYQSFHKSEIHQAQSFCEKIGLPIVIKADGLAAGKGVVICHSVNEAHAEIAEMFNGKFGESSDNIVIEQFLNGIEFSVFVITDGKNFKILPTAKDYKRIGEGDTGLNTGGMGAVSPVPFVTQSIMQRVETTIVKPTIDGLYNEKIEYKGIVYVGIMLVGDKPYVIEYNCRMGDPETQVVLPRLQNDLLELINSVFDNTLENQCINISSKACITNVIASRGYPEKSESDVPITLCSTNENEIIFHAGTKINNEQLCTNGGRVLCTTALSDTLELAQTQARELAEKIRFDGKYFRRDIGNDIINRN